MLRVVGSGQRVGDTKLVPESCRLVVNIWLTELAFICIVFAAGMSHFISAKINW